MRARTLERAAAAITTKASATAVAVRVDENVWIWAEGPGLWLRAKPGDVRAGELSTPHPHDVAFLREACGARAEGPVLAVERGEPTTIDGVPIPTPYATLLEGLEDGHGPLTWRRWRRWQGTWGMWLAARGPSGAVVALWKVLEKPRAPQ
jgi:hypothetical protein